MDRTDRSASGVIGSIDEDREEGKIQFPASERKENKSKKVMIGDNLKEEQKQQAANILKKYDVFFDVPGSTGRALH